ncbi:hypothetical protein B0T20DRAFT_98175 [Sordaria brevicollis]|uniref:Uncharacterized protein n=1 Tax=Sordaria brevicollis TaxID=83679 RepID=A0AAE0NVJ7_SORBR|nr:hypothetical protein B0T20DRAFT_98175 [Sordaria brevicollis]
MQAILLVSAFLEKLHCETALIPHREKGLTAVRLKKQGSLFVLIPGSVRKQSDFQGMKLTTGGGLEYAIKLSGQRVSVPTTSLS